MLANEYGDPAPVGGHVQARLPRHASVSREEAARRIRRAQVACNQALTEFLRTLGKGNKSFFDARQFRSGEDFQVPPGMDFDPAADDWDRAWLNEDALRLVLVFEALASRVEFRVAPDRTVTLRVHFV